MFHALSPNRPSRELTPYQGTETSLVISIDLGTTFSGSSWALLEPDQIPEIVDVSGYTGQEFQSASTKVPTVLYYDRTGAVKAAGSETCKPEIISEAEKHSWIRVQGFKLLLNPPRPDDSGASAFVSPLPPGKNIFNVVGDFLGYMSRSSIRHFKDRMINSRAIWEKVQDNIVCVLSHPNEWYPYQQNEMRRAAIYGRLVPDTDDGRSRVHFVSEGEASLHWCDMKGVNEGGLHVGNDITLVDAGEVTIDVSSYTVVSTTPLELKERRMTDSRLAGSIFVTQAFERFARAKLEHASAYGDERTISILREDFDKSARVIFRRKDRRLPVEFGTFLVNDPLFDIQAGRLLVEGSVISITDIADFFEASCNAAADMVRNHASTTSRTTVFFTGSFAASPWLYAELKRRVADLDVEIFRTGAILTAPLAANRAIGFYLDQQVQAVAQASSRTYGVSHAKRLDSRSDPKHVKRLSRVYIDSNDGDRYIADAFQVQLRKGAVLEETALTRFPFYRSFFTQNSETIISKILCYHGDKVDIQFLDEDEPDMFQRFCSIKADIPRSCLMQQMRMVAGAPQYYWDCRYRIVASFGTTLFRCFVEWTDKNNVIHCAQRHLCGTKTKPRIGQSEGNV